jgi:lysophospholipase L1-like esterase
MISRPLVALILAGALAPTAIPRAAAGQERPTPAGRGPIVFVGSSIFHRWTRLDAQMAPLPIVNQAFDGSQTTDMLRMVDSRVLPYRPSVIAYYCGSNDVDAGEPAQAIFERIRQFVARVSTASPATRIVFVSINRAPEKRALWSVVDDVNARMEALAKQSKSLQYVDVNPVLFNGDGTPRMELYLSDQLHFRPPAYELLAGILKPVLTTAFEAH